MSRTPAKIIDRASSETGHVYIAKLGEHIKIGFSRDVSRRLKTYKTSTLDVFLLLAIPGDMDLEKLILNLLEEDRIRNEIFRESWRIDRFVTLVEEEGIESGLRWLEETVPAKREAAKSKAMTERVRIARQTKAEKNAYFASLVAQRKQRIGW